MLVRVIINVEAERLIELAGVLESAGFTAANGNVNLDAAAPPSQHAQHKPAPAQSPRPAPAPASARPERDRSDYPQVSNDANLISQKQSDYIIDMALEAGWGGRQIVDFLESPDGYGRPWHEITKNEASALINEMKTNGYPPPDAPF